MFREAKLEADKRSADFGAQLKDFGAQLSILDKSMKSWVAGDEFTLADICLAPIVARCLRFGVELPALPNVKRWDGEIGKREAFKKATAS
jgi:glutathione S-transferase